jgi:hypothetical protein
MLQLTETYITAMYGSSKVSDHILHPYKPIVYKYFSKNSYKHEPY